MELPVELGLPAKFLGWRPGQGELIEEIALSGKHYFLLDAPTGWGKSIIGIATYKKIALPIRVMRRMLDEDELKPRCVYVTRTKQLQGQILAEFPEAKSLKGRNNYPCLNHEDEFPEYNAEHCTGVDRCKESPNCPYLLDKDLALRAEIVVLNDAYYLAEINGPGRFSQAEFVILDEVDSIEAALMNFIQFTVTQKQLVTMNLTPPSNHGIIDAWVAWADQASQKLLSGKAYLERQLNSLDPSLWSGVELDLQKQVKKIEKFRAKLIQFVFSVNDFWTIAMEDSDDGLKWIFKPVMVGEYADQYLWRHSDRVLGMSGTIFDPSILANEIGLDNFEYKAIPSIFPKEHRPIFYRPVANITHKTREVELPKLAAEVAAIIEKYPDDKVLVHTVSYYIRDYLLSALPAGRLITHSSSTREETLVAFKNSGDPLVMLSPSFDRGVDFKGDYCRCVIICKVPFLNMGDEQTKRRMRMEDGQRWYTLRAAQTMVQMSGRGVRSEDDYCDTYILDKQFDKLKFQLRHILPKWWLEAIQ